MGCSGAGNHALQRSPQTWKAPKRLVRGRFSDLPPFPTLTAFSLAMCSVGIGYLDTIAGNGSSKEGATGAIELSTASGTQRPDRPGI